MARGTTLFERWREQRKLASAAFEEIYLNPLKIRLGDSITIDRVNWKDLEFQVQQFRVVTRKIGKRDFPLTDYHLIHRGLDGREVSILLRFIPLAAPDLAAGITHSVYLLDLVDAFAYSSEVMDVLKMDQGYTYFRSRGEESVAECFPTRVGDVHAPYGCDVDIVQDKDHDGEVEKDEIESHKLTLWDFWRSTSVEGVDTTQYLFVEVDEEDGWTELFQGEEIRQLDVQVYPKER